MKIAIDYDDTLQGFLTNLYETTGLSLPCVGDMNHREFCSCVGIAENGSEWSFITRRNFERIQDETAQCAAHDPSCFLWYPTYRTKSRAGRVIRRLYLAAGLKEPSAQFIADIVRQWDLYNQDGGSYQFKLLRGEEIRYAYDERHYVSNERGTLAQSCMRYKECADYMDLYTENDAIQLAVLIYDRRIAARCLVWNDMYHDRIWSMDNYTEDLLRAKCREREWSDIWRSGRHLSVQLKYVEHSDYPYLDTFCYIGMDSKCAFTYQPRERYRYCQDCGGGYSESKHYECAECGRAIDDDDMYNVDDEHYCGDCCTYADDIGEYVRNDDAIYCEPQEVCIYYQNAVELYNGHYCELHHAVELYNGSYAYERDEDLVTLYNGEYAIASDENIEYLDCGEYAHCDDIVETMDGEYALRDACSKIDGVWIRNEDVIFLYDGRAAHIDNAVKTYNGLMAHVDDCNILRDGAWCLKDDPIYVFERMPKQDRDALAVLL